MAIDIDELHKRANEIYEERKGYVWNGYTAPECRPRIQSDQVKAVMEALQEKINFELDGLRADIEKLKFDLGR